MVEVMAVAEDGREKTEAVFLEVEVVVILMHHGHNTKEAEAHIYHQQDIRMKMHKCVSPSLSGRR